MANPEAKINFLGKELTPRRVVLGGIILIFGGVLARFEPSIAVPAIIVGTGMMVYGSSKMEQQRLPPQTK